jgi:hypothetical protein
VYTKQHSVLIPRNQFGGHPNKKIRNKLVSD